MVRCEDGSLYTGITTDVARRFQEHASGGPKAAKYTRTHGAVEVAVTWDAPDRAAASRLEYRLKRLTHSEKERLAANPSEVASLL